MEPINLSLSQFRFFFTIKICPKAQVQPDLTLVELQEKLLQQQHLQVSLVSIWKALKSCSGLLASMTVEASTDTEVFLAFLDQVLCPQLRAGQIVVMDNLSAHKVAAVRAKIKQILRSLKARTAEALDEAITQALACITAENARGWFQHCGYQITQNVKTV